MGNLKKYCYNRKIVAVIAILLLAVGVAAGFAAGWFSRTPASKVAEGYRVKVLVVTMCGSTNTEDSLPNVTQLWIEGKKLDQVTEVPGSYSPLYCNAAGDYCLVITGMGTANSAATITAVGLSDQVDLTEAYILVAGVAGTQPEDGTIGAAAWAEWVVDGDLAHEIDAREMPANWSYPYFHLGCTEPWCDGWTAGTEVYHLNPTLTEWAYQLSKDVELADSEQAQACRSNYPEETAARQTPFVTKCDSFASSTYWQGTTLSDWAEWWMNQFTCGQGDYCMTNMEDTGTLAALSRLAAAGRIDLNRVMVLRTASDFDQPYPGQTTLQSLQQGIHDECGGYTLAVQNAYRVSSVVADYIVTHWDEWENGVPPLP